MTDTPYFVIDDLTIGYHKVPVIRDISVKVQKGEIIALIGAQPIVAGLHIRNRHRSAHRRLQQIVRTRFGSATGTLARRRVG